MISEEVHIDVCIVGGGILGLWSAYFILKKYPNYTVVILEKEKLLGRAHNF